MNTCCPKCGVQWPTDKPLPLTECPSCGVIFAKFLAAREDKRKRAAEKEAQVARAAEKAAAKVKPAPAAPALARATLPKGLAECAICGGTVAIGANACPHCGAPGPKKSPSAIIVASALIFVMVIVIGSIAGRNKPPDPGRFSIQQRESMRMLIELAGYKCDGVSYMGELLTKPGFRVTCNADRYVYAIVDEGGRWKVRLD